MSKAECVGQTLNAVGKSMRKTQTDGEKHIMASRQTGRLAAATSEFKQQSSKSLHCQLMMG
jgi:hypothetical protein